MKKVIMASIIALSAIGLVGCDRVEPGNSVTTINTTPDKTGWTCDDGVTYWK